MATLVGSLSAVLGMDVRGFQAGTLVATRSLRTLQAAATATSATVATTTRSFTAATVAAKALGAATSVGGLLVVSLIAAVVQHARSKNQALQAAADEQDKMLRGLKQTAEKIKFETREIARAQREQAQAGLAWANRQLATVGEAEARGQNAQTRAMSRAVGLPFLTREQAAEQRATLRAWLMTYEGTLIAAGAAIQEFDKEAAEAAALSAFRKRMDLAKESVDEMADSLRASEIAMQRWLGVVADMESRGRLNIDLSAGVRGVPTMPVLPGAAIDAGTEAADIRQAEAAREAAQRIRELGDAARDSAFAILAGIAGAQGGPAAQGAVSGVMAGLAEGNPFAAILGGVAGFVTGLVEESRRAEEAAERMRAAVAGWRAEMQRLTAAIGAEGFLADLHRAVDDILDSFRTQTGLDPRKKPDLTLRDLQGSGPGGPLFTGNELDDAIANWRRMQAAFSAGTAEWEAWEEAINRATALLEHQRKVWAELARAVEEDYRVRLLYAQGFDDAAEALRLQLELERELARLKKDLGEAYTPEIEALVRLVYETEKLQRAQEKQAEAARQAAEEAEKQAEAERQLAEAHRQAAEAARQAALAATDLIAGLTDRLVQAGLMTKEQAFAWKQTSEMNRWIEQGLPQWILEMLMGLQEAERDAQLAAWAAGDAGTGATEPDRRTQAVLQQAQSITSTQALHMTHQLSTANVYLSEIAKNTRGGAAGNGVRSGPSFSVSVNVSGDVYADSAFGAGRKLARGIAAQLNEDWGSQVATESYNTGVVQVR